ncbi:MAG: BatD family protein, partial [Bacteroidota bacterium]
MKRIFYLIIFFCLTISILVSQTFTASVSKKTVAVGEYFQIAFSVNSNASNFTPPDFKDFDIYSGPNQSSSMSFVNGVMSSSISLSYYLVPKREGKFTIGPAKISAGGKQLQSNPIAIEVVKGNNSNVASGNSNGNNNYNSGQGNQRNENSVNSGGENIFIKTFVSKQKCFLGEQITVTQKIYSVHQMKGFQNYKAPAYNGFWSKEENRSAQLTQKTENFDGNNYYVVEFNSTI